MHPNCKTNQPTTTSPSLYPRLGNLDLIKTLNYGITSKVKLGRDASTKKEYAVKIIKNEFQTQYLATLEQEAKFLKLVNQEEHPHIVKLIESRSKADYIKKNGTIKKVFALIFELAEGGDLYECIKALGDFKEEIARTYFHQLISTVEHLHDRGIIHGDLKLENLLLSADFSLKIADFSFATYLLDQNNTPIQRQRLGTPSYMAPELLANADYVGQSADLFSCGVILFLMTVGQPPFDKAHLQDNRYKLILKYQFPQFWKQFEQRNRAYSEDFKDLINAMLTSDPTQRLSISEIKAHPWYNGKTCPVEELQQEYEARKQDFLSYQEEKAKEMKKLKEMKALKKKEIENIHNNITKPKLNHFFMKGITPLGHRSISLAVNQEMKNRVAPTDLDKARTGKEYVFTGFRSLSEHFYDIDQSTMFKLILLLANKLFNNYKVHASEYKIKGRVISDTTDFTGEIMIDITYLDEDSCCLGVTKIKGALLPFYRFIEEILKEDIDTALKKFVEGDK